MMFADALTAFLPEFLQLPQMQRAFVIAMIAGPTAGLLGTFITLKGMSFFSDAISHGAMTGIALGLLLSITNDVNSAAMQVVLVFFCTAMALLMAWLLERTTLRPDTIIAFTFTGSVALGVVIIQKLRGYQMLENALFGNILGAGWEDIWVISGLSLLVVGFLVFNGRALCLLIVQESLAKVEGIRVRLLNYLFIVMIAIVIALLLKQLGALLISGLIVIPAAAARMVAPNFRAMLVLGALFGLLGACGGIWASYEFDTPTGPTIVLSDLALLVAALIVAAFLRRGLGRGSGKGTDERFQS